MNLIRCNGSDILFGCIYVSKTCNFKMQRITLESTMYVKIKSVLDLKTEYTVQIVQEPYYPMHLIHITKSACSIDAVGSRLLDTTNGIHLCSGIVSVSQMVLLTRQSLHFIL